MIREYIRLTMFAAGLLVGVQVPSFVDQYYQRVDAHLIEAHRNIAGFQQTADRYFSGDITGLIDHYASSTDRVFQDDSASVKAIHARVAALTAEMRIAGQSWYRRTQHVFYGPNAEIFDETLRQYTYTVPLNQQAIVWGIGVGMSGALIAELSLLALFGIFRLGSKRKAVVSR